MTKSERFLLAGFIFIAPHVDVWIAIGMAGAFFVFAVVFLKDRT
jgi:hypothetical protein